MREISHRSQCILRHKRLCLSRPDCMLPYGRQSSDSCLDRSAIRERNPLPLDRKLRALNRSQCSDYEKSCDVGRGGRPFIMTRTGLSKHGNQADDQNGINNEKYEIYILNGSNAPILINRISLTCQFKLICVFF